MDFCFVYCLLLQAVFDVLKSKNLRQEGFVFTNVGLFIS